MGLAPSGTEIVSEDVNDKRIRWFGGTRLPFTVGRGPVPRHALDERKHLNLWGLGHFLLRLLDRGGQAPALRWVGGTRLPFTVGRGPVPRHASDERKRLNLWRLGRFLLCSNDRGGQAPALRKKGSLNHREGQAPALRYTRPAFFL